MSIIRSSKDCDLYVWEMGDGLYSISVARATPRVSIDLFKWPSRLIPIQLIFLINDLLELVFGYKHKTKYSGQYYPDKTALEVYTIIGHMKAAGVKVPNSVFNDMWALVPPEELLDPMNLR